MSYQDIPWKNETTKKCELCTDEYVTKNPRSRLCPNCQRIELSAIKPVLGDTSYRHASPEQKKRILERARADKTTRRSNGEGFFDIKHPKKFEKKVEKKRNWR